DAWNAPDGLILRGHKDRVEHAAYSPDGKRILTASRDGTVKAWDAGTGQELFTLKGHTATVYLAKFSPDGKRIVSASTDSTVRLWDAQAGKALLTIRVAHRRLLTLGFSQSGRLVQASGIGDRLDSMTWDAQSGLPSRLEEPPAPDPRGSPSVNDQH